MAVTPGNPTEGGGPATTGEHVLACGRTVEALWGQLEAGGPAVDDRDDHAPGCPHCATARVSLQRLVAATELLVDDPERPEPGLLDRIMSAVRADLGHGETLVLPTPLGGADVSLTALRGVLRFAVDTVDGLRARRCRVEPVVERPGVVRVRMSLSLRYGAAHEQRLAQARQRAIAALTDRVGIVAESVDFEIVDIHTDVHTDIPTDIPTDPAPPGAPA